MSDRKLKEKAVQTHPESLQVEKKAIPNGKRTSDHNQVNPEVPTCLGSTSYMNRRSFNPRRIESSL